MVFDLQTNFSLEEEKREQNTHTHTKQLKRKLIICFNEKSLSERRLTI